ncbi:MAG TPA: DUF4433 domain-containing protein [Nannocystis exedens]|nr:DUF4433 domain-containing protein [Nannocystis exedens]
MRKPPKEPKIYHITHVDNLPAIIARGELLADSEMVEQGGPAAPIGMRTLKDRRLSIECMNDLMVGACVPFYLCPRSVMLYVLHRGNHPDLSYTDGQGPIVHLEADLRKTVAWAESCARRWTLSTTNAASFYTDFRFTLQDLGDLCWSSIAARDWRQTTVREGKQAEFLVETSFAWPLVERIGVHSQGTLERATCALAKAAHRPVLEIRKEWYY